MNEKKGKHWKLIIPGIILALVLLIAAVFHVNEITVEGNTFFSQEPGKYVTPFWITMWYLPGSSGNLDFVRLFLMCVSIR